MISEFCQNNIFENSWLTIIMLELKITFRSRAYACWWINHKKHKKIFR